MGYIDNDVRLDTWTIDGVYLMDSRPSEFDLVYAEQSEDDENQNKKESDSSITIEINSPCVVQINLGLSEAAVDR